MTFQEWMEENVPIHHRDTIAKNDWILVWMREAWNAGRAQSDKPQYSDQEWIDTAECPHCGRETTHDFYCAGHERDSSGDWKECIVCGARCSGLTDEYGPPRGK